MHKDEKIVEVLDRLSQRLTAGMNKKSIRVAVDDPPPFQGVSEFPFQVIEEIPRRLKVTQLLFGSTISDLIGFNDGRFPFETERIQLKVLNVKVLTVVTKVDLEEVVRQLSRICGKEVFLSTGVA